MPTLACANFAECNTYCHQDCFSKEDPTRCGVCVWKKRVLQKRIDDADGANSAGPRRQFVPDSNAHNQSSALKTGAVGMRFPELGLNKAPAPPSQPSSPRKATTPPPHRDITAVPDSPPKHETGVHKREGRRLVFVCVLEHVCWWHLTPLFVGST